MERARWNTELSHKKITFVICPTFWGHTIMIQPLFKKCDYFYGSISCSPQVLLIHVAIGLDGSHISDGQVTVL